ncbi:hypothetical protein AAT17_12630 [Nonlabens sp. MIC269]|nr:hypothetical protein AAT17_12630 [Nonlabens sp. MIC269]
MVTPNPTNIILKRKQKKKTLCLVAWPSCQVFWKKSCAFDMAIQTIQKKTVNEVDSALAKPAVTFLK